MLCWVILKFIIIFSVIIFEQGALYFYFAPSPINYIAGPGAGPHSPHPCLSGAPHSILTLSQHPRKKNVLSAYFVLQVALGAQEAQ